MIIKMLNDMQEETCRRLDSIDDNLRDHMRRTELLENRVDVLEEPSKAIKWVKNLIIGLGTIAGSIFGIIKLLEYL